MPWNHTLNQFESPDYDSGPIGYIAQKSLDLVAAEEGRAITWWNNRWATKIGYTLLPINSSSMFVGSPVDPNARALYCLINGEVREGDNQEERATFTYLYITGNTNLAAPNDGKFGQVIISSFVLKMIASILQTAPDEKFTDGWPDDNGPGLIKTLRLERPDAKLIQELDPKLGVQMVLTMDLQINPYPIPRI
jgi:hypothetical protein